MHKYTSYYLLNILYLYIIPGDYVVEDVHYINKFSTILLIIFFYIILISNLHNKIKKKINVLTFIYV